MPKKTECLSCGHDHVTGRRCPKKGCRCGRNLPPKPKKRIPTSVEIANDPSLRWFPYRMWELVYSDATGELLRFVRYEGDAVVLATVNGMAELPGTVGFLTVRRPTAK